MREATRHSARAAGQAPEALGAEEAVLAQLLVDQLCPKCGKACLQPPPTPTPDHRHAHSRVLAPNSSTSRVNLHIDRNWRWSVSIKQLTGRR